MTAVAERGPGTGAPGTGTTASAVTMAAALNRALADALSDDETVLVFGEDVGTLGGVFRVTDGLAATFGEARVFDTPLTESGIVGTAIGMAMNGLRPVVEMQFDAFAYPAFEQITSHLAKLRNRTRGRVALPVVIRIPYGGGIGSVEHHCDSSEVYYAHTAGLRVVTPATPGDAYALLRKAIECQDPVIFLEPKRRYWSKETTVLDHGGSTLDRAIVRRPGSDVTLIAYGGTLATALEAADAAAEDDLSVEVIDLRSLSPFDDETVTESVRRTGRAVVVHEASRFCGYGAEVAARLSEQCFFYLEAPVMRVTGFDIPYPPPHLEEYHLPSVDRILDAIGSLQWEEGRPVGLPNAPKLIDDQYGLCRQDLWHALEAVQHQFPELGIVAGPDQQHDVGIPRHQCRVLHLRDRHDPGAQRLPRRLSDLQVHVRGQAVPVSLRIHLGGIAGNHPGLLQSLDAHVGTGPGDVQAGRQRPHGNAPVLTQDRHDGPVDVVERVHPRSRAIMFAWPGHHDAKLPRNRPFVCPRYLTARRPHVFTMQHHY
jgi:2-oxoisovalerate dehydrogenase E1 component beta subunit